jgi:hypothetical protein
MEMVAIILGLVILIFLMLYVFSEGFTKEAFIIFICLFISQLFWFPCFLDTKVEEKTLYTDQYKIGGYETTKFSQIVKIKEKRVYKPLSALHDKTTYTISFPEMKSF